VQLQKEAEARQCRFIIAVLEFFHHTVVQMPGGVLHLGRRGVPGRVGQRLRGGAGQRPAGTAFAIGEWGLTTALHEAGYTLTERDPDYVVLEEGARPSALRGVAWLVGALVGYGALVRILWPAAPATSPPRPR